MFVSSGRYEEDEDDRPQDGEILEFIRDTANPHVYRCPIRLFDMCTRTVITREELASQLIESVVKHVSTRPTWRSSISETVEEDLKAGHDRAASATDKNLYSYSDVYNLIKSYSRYAILSHRWSETELLFSDIPSLDDMKMRKPGGYNKLTGFARIIKIRDRLCRYLWIDTFCIDKTSSAELDESIRSMYTWYADSHVCIVHLAQTRSCEKLADDPWFRRGWTLQELLAPCRIKFYAFDWSPLFPNTILDINRPNSKHYNNDASHPEIKESIATAAGIDPQYLHGTLSPTPNMAPLVFSWADRRKTSRPEDIAYCLIGLLGVHLPIAYGEGEESAFGRLQVTCLQSSSSRGLFLWYYYESSNINSMLAPSPSAFTFPICDIRCDTVAGFEDMDTSFSLTNAGLRIKMWLFQVRSPEVVDGQIHGYIFERDDVEIGKAQGMDDAINKFEKGTLLVGVLGFISADVPLAIILSKDDGYWVRDTDFSIDRLPDKAALERSGEKPKRIFIK